MGLKRITRAEAQHGMTLIENELRDCDAYAGDVQGRVRAALKSTPVPPQREGDKLEDDERRNKHYKEISEILTARAKTDAEKLIPEEEDFKSAERATFMRRSELERLKLEKSDPELDERQWQMLSDIKAKLVEYPVLLGEVTGDKAFLQGIKNNYESKLEGYETIFKSLMHEVFRLPMTCSSKVSDLLNGFTERTLKPAINIVKLQHERLETELGEADERSEQLERRVEELEKEAEAASEEKMRLDVEREGREKNLTEEIAATKKKLETEQHFNRTQDEKHKREMADLKAKLEKARTTAAEEVAGLQAELHSYSEEAKGLRDDKEKLEESVQGWRERVNARRQELTDLKAKCKANEEQRKTAEEQLFSLEEAMEAEKEAAVAVKEAAEQEKESLRNDLKAVKEARNSAELQIQSVTSQLAAARTEMDSLKQSNTRQVQQLEGEISAAKAENESLSQRWESRNQSLQSQLSTAENEKESLKHSSETELQSVVKSKQELEIRYGRATEISKLMSRLIQWHISTIDNISMGEFESEVVLREMGAIIDTMEQYPGSATEAVSMPKYMPGMTLIWKATEIPEPNLAAARHLWISSRCGSLVLDVAQAFFTQQEITSAQFALLPWIYASLDRAVITMCEKSTLTPDVARSFLCILRGLVYTATVAREWSEDRAWIPKVVEILAKIGDWLREHVPNDEASLLMMVMDQVNEIVTHKSPPTSISPNLFAEAQRIDSANSDIPNGMAMVMDNSGMIILFTADDNAFIFGASEVKAVDFDNSGNVVFIFKPQVSGLPENLREIRLHDRGSPEAVNIHTALLRSALPKELLVVVSIMKYFRPR